MSMPKPVCPNMANASPLGSQGPRRRSSSTPGRSRWTRSHLPPESIFPRARRGRSLPRCGELSFRTPPRHRAPEPGPGRTLIPGDGAARDQRTENGPACPAMAATRRLRAVPSQRLPGTCRLVTSRPQRPRSTWPDQARLPLTAVAHRYKRARCLRRDNFRPNRSGVRKGRLSTWRDTD
jgi:hypothetical protein